MFSSGPVSISVTPSWVFGLNYEDGSSLSFFSCKLQPNGPRTVSQMDQSLSQLLLVWFLLYIMKIVPAHLCSLCKL